MDDKSKRGTADRSRINLSQHHEVSYWTNPLGVSEDELSSAIKKVGSSANMVAETLLRRLQFSHRSCDYRERRMQRPEKPSGVEPATRLSTLVQKSRDMPDRLVAILLDLNPLCEGEVENLPLEAKRRIANACNGLQLAVADAAAIAGYVNRLVARTGGAIDSQTFPPALKRTDPYDRTKDL